MVKGKAKAEHQLHKYITGQGYRLRRGYEIVRCATAKCGYKIRKIKK